jgi:hypothetical protein
VVDDGTSEVGPLNDAHTVAENHTKRSYRICFMHNPTTEEFMAFFKTTSKALTIYDTGHGAHIRDRSGDESDGLDEAIVFDQGFILDNKLVQTLKENANGKAKMLLLSDCCHSGSIWDLQSAINHGEQLPDSETDDSQQDITEDSLILPMEGNQHQARNNT